MILPSEMAAQSKKNTEDAIKALEAHLKNTETSISSYARAYDKAIFRPNNSAEEVERSSEEAIKKSKENSTNCIWTPDKVTVIQTRLCSIPKLPSGYPV